MKVLLTGAAGRLGRSFLAGTPADVDIEVLLSPTGLFLGGYPWYRADITDREKVIMAVTCADPDVVIHCAALTDVDRCESDPGLAFRVNRDGTGHIARACNECGARMVNLSTDHVFDGVSGPYEENDHPNPVNVYGRSKLEGEQAAGLLAGNLTIVRIAVLFGKRFEGVKHNFVSWVIEQLRARKHVHAWSDQVTTPAYLEELTELLWTLIRTGENGVFHYGTSDRLSRYRMMLDICEVMGFDSHLVEPLKFADSASKAQRPLESGFITGKVREVLKRPPVFFTDALGRMIEAQKKEPAQDK